MVGSFEWSRCKLSQATSPSANQSCGFDYQCDKDGPPSAKDLGVKIAHIVKIKEDARGIANWKFVILCRALVSSGSNCQSNRWTFGIGMRVDSAATQRCSESSVDPDWMRFRDEMVALAEPWIRD